MTNFEGGLNPNTIPTSDEIWREALFLDAHGIKVSGLVAEHPVDLNKWINKQDILAPLIDAMAESDWEYAGSGFFSAVFVKGGLALKIGFKVNDTGAMYAAWCRSNEGKAGVPKVYSLTKFTGCYVVLTRRYETLDKAWIDPDHDHFIPEMAEEFGCIQGAINRGDRVVLHNRFDTVQTAADIRTFFEGIVDWDLHKGNVMLDSETGELVITDPISHGPCSGSTGSYYYYSTETTEVA